MAVECQHVKFLVPFSVLVFLTTEAISNKEFSGNLEMFTPILLQKFLLSVIIPKVKTV